MTTTPTRAVTAATALLEELDTMARSARTTVRTAARVAALTAAAVVGLLLTCAGLLLVLVVRS